MDFHSLTRRELQSLCKLNKIPANITNVAMADALQALHIVEGVEKFMNDSQYEKAANLVESAETIGVPSPKAPNTRCRTSTRQKVKISETENLPPTATRTTRRTTKQLVGGVKDVLKTPAISSTTRKSRSTSSCGNVNNQLNECHKESLMDQKMESVPSSPATIVTNSKKKVTTASTITLKKESPVQKMRTYSMRSTRLTEKKSTEPRVKKDSEKAVKIKSFSEEVNVTSEEDVSTVESACDQLGNPNAQVEDICNAFEKLDVLPVVEEIDQCLVLEKAVDVESAHKSGEEIKDCVDLVSLKQKLDETSNPCEDDKEDKLMMGEQLDMGENDCTEAAIDVSSPCEKEKLEQKLDLEDEKFDASEVKDLNLVMVQEEQSDSLFDNNAGLESRADDIEAIPFNKNLSAVSEINNLVPENNGSSTMVDDMILDNTENPIESLNSDNENNFDEAPEITTNDMEQMSENAGSSTMVGDMILDNTENPIESLNSDNENNFGETPEITTNDMEQMSENAGSSTMVGVMILENTENPIESLNSDNENNFDEAPEITTNDMEQMSENAGSSTMVGDMILDNTENPIESLNSDNENNFGEASEITTNDMEQMSENAGSSTMVGDMILDNTENPIESLNSDNENNFGEAPEITTKDMEQMSENTVDETVDVIPTIDNDSPVIEEVQDLIENNVNKKVDADSDEKDQFSVVSVPCFPIENPLIRPPTSVTPMKNAIPFKNMSIVSNDKENIDSGRSKLQIVFVDEGKNGKKDESERLRKLNEISIRQLRKQVKALTLKNINSNEEKEALTTRPALQTICENKLVGGETTN